MIGWDWEFQCGFLRMGLYNVCWFFFSIVLNVVAVSFVVAVDTVLIDSVGSCIEWDVHRMGRSIVGTGLVSSSLRSDTCSTQRYHLPPCAIDSFSWLDSVIWVGHQAVVASSLSILLVPLVVVLALASRRRGWLNILMNQIDVNLQTNVIIIFCTMKNLTSIRYLCSTQCMWLWLLLV